MITAPKLWRVVCLVLTLLTLLSFTVAQPQDSADGARKVLTRTTPAYPALAKSMRISGIVHLEILVAPNGSVKSAEVKGGHPVLAQAAQAAVMQWRYSVAPRETHETVEVKFDPQ